MDDRTTSLIDRLQREPVTVGWADVEARLESPLGVELDPIAPPHPARRWLLAAAAAVLVVAAIAAVAIAGGEPTNHVATEPTPPAPTTIPDSGQTRFGALTVWTGTDYLVWGGEVDGDGSETDTGWRFSPATGETEPLAPSPLPAAWSPAGVWTGDELIVCCGSSSAEGAEAREQAGAAHAAAYDPAADEWRAIAEPPAAARSTVVGSAWTGTEALVVVQLGDHISADYGDEGLGLFAYDPATDTWHERAKPTGGDRFGEAVWTGEQLVLWFQRAPGWDGGVIYDPAADAWSDLPALPTDRPVFYGSATFTDDQLVVFGLDGNDETRTVGYRLRLGDLGWKPMADAPIPAIDWYEGTPGSQTILADASGERVIVYPTHGYERGAGGATGAPPNLLVYVPATDEWTERDPLAAGATYEPDLTAAGDLVLWPNLDDPIVHDLSS